MSASFPVSLASETTATDPGTGASEDLELDGTSVRLWLEVTTPGATPLVVTVQHSHNGVSWSTPASWAPMTITGAGAVRGIFPGAMRYVRVTWTGGGGASFSVQGEHVLVYATPADVKLLGLAGKNLPPEVTDTEVDAAVEAAGGLIDSYIGQATTDDGDPLYEVPLEEWGQDVRRAAAIITGYDLISARIGYNAEQPGDDPFRKRYEDVIRWLEAIAAGDAVLVGTEPPTPTATVGRVLFATSNPPRGW